MNKIEYDPFTLRQFKPDFRGTNLSRTDMSVLLSSINSAYAATDSKFFISGPLIKLADAQADFCKYLIFKNPFAEIKSAVTKINLNIYPYIRTTYSSRTPDELPVLNRWAELPPGFELPVAEWLVCVLYTREQLLKEFLDKSSSTGDAPKDAEAVKKQFYFDESVEYGIVCVLGTMTDDAEPMVPITAMRNALGTTEGGNGLKLDREAYMKSVEFWNTHIMVK